MFSKIIPVHTYTCTLGNAYENEWLNSRSHPGKTNSIMLCCSILFVFVHIIKTNHYKFEIKQWSIFIYIAYKKSLLMQYRSLPTTECQVREYEQYFVILIWVCWQHKIEIKNYTHDGAKWWNASTNENVNEVNWIASYLYFTI